MGLEYYSDQCGQSREQDWPEGTVQGQGVERTDGVLCIRVIVLIHRPATSIHQRKTEQNHNFSGQGFFFAEAYPVRNPRPEGDTGTSDELDNVKCSGEPCNQGYRLV